MQELLRQLFRHPEVAMLAFAALVAVVGGAIKRAAELAGRGKGAAPPAAPTAGRPPDVGKARRPSPEEVAAEMRQILGMDEKAEPQSAAPPAPKGRKPAAGWKPAPARQPTRSRQPAARKPAATQKPAAARAPTSRSLRDLGQMDVHVDP